jgi:ComF family protein
MALDGLQPDMALIPVPLHPARQRARGYNQSRLLADNIAKLTKARVVHDRLRRTRKTLDQIALDSAGRRTNGAGAFTWRGDPLDGGVILVDDVLTTGSTLCACADAVREAGVQRVEAVVFACAYHSHGAAISHTPGDTTQLTGRDVQDYDA